MCPWAVLTGSALAGVDLCHLSPEAEKMEQPWGEAEIRSTVVECHPLTVLSSCVNSMQIGLFIVS